MTEIRVGNNICQIVTPDKDILKDLSAIMSYEVPGAKFVIKHKPWWDGRIKLLQRNGVFPSGLLPLAVNFFSERGVRYELVDYKGNKPDRLGFCATFDLTPRYYQLDALEVSKKANNGVFVIGVGGGKSFLSGMVTDDKKVPTLVVVPNLDLKEQFLADYKRWFGRHVSSNVLRGSIVVANYQSLVKQPKEVFERFKMLIIDEFHHCSATSLKTINENCVGAYYKYGFSATFLRTDGTDMEMYGVLSNVIYTKSAYDLIKEGFLVKPIICMVNFTANGYPFGYAAAYNTLTRDKEFNELICYLARKVSTTKQTLILVKRIEHGRVLAEMLDCVFLNGQLDTDYRNETKEKFINKEIKLLVATNIFGEGVNIPSIECLINARAEKSEIMTRQGIGRALRLAPGKEEALIFDFNIVGQKHLNEHSKERIRSYREEKFDVKTINPTGLP